MKKILSFLFIIISILIFDLTSVSAEATANSVVLMNGEHYDSIKDALNDIHNNTQTSLTLIKDRTENITIPVDRNIVLDLNNYTLRNDGNNNVIVNNGTLEIKNGTITSDAKSGMINNNKNAKLYLNSGSLIATGKRQVLYNDEGTAYISGDVYIESASDERAAVHNKTNGRIYITGGTIVSKGLYAIYNEKGSIDIGTKDGDFNTATPIIQGKTYGVAANYRFNYYDGIIKGGTSPVGMTSNTGNTPSVSSDTELSKISDIEELSTKKLDNEIIGGINYKTLVYEFADSIIKVTFDPNGGSVSPSYIRLNAGTVIGSLPKPVKEDHIFEGWFTDEDGGVQINENTRPVLSSTYYAHWTYVDPNTIAYVEGFGLTSLKNAFLLGGNIRLEKDVVITEPLEMGKSATFDLNGHILTLDQSSITVTDDVIITDSSSSKSGKITSNSDFTLYVGKKNLETNAKLTFKGGTIEGLGEYGAIRNYETLVIDGGKAQGTALGDLGYVVYNENYFNMKSGTVYSSNGRAVQVHKNSNFVMDGGLLKSDAENDQTLNLYGDCSATINDGTIEGLNNNTAGIAMFKNTNLTINGGTITGDAMAVAGNGSDNRDNANVTVNGGTLTAINGIGMYLPQQNSKAVINGGTISGLTGIELRASDLTINGGTINGTSDTYQINYNASGTTSKGCAVAVSQHNTKKAINVVINDGDLNAIVPLCEANPMNNPQEAIDLITISINQGKFTSTSGGDSIILQDTIPINSFITGGTYTSDPTNHVKDGYAVVKLSDNKFIVTKIYNVVLVQNDMNLVSTEKDKYLYKDIVKLNINDGSKYSITISVKDANGNTIKLNNNSFIMPESDVTITVAYNEIINPTTGDFIFNYIVLLTMSSLGLIIFTKKLIKA